MRLVFMGSSWFAVPALRALRRAGHAVVSVVTRPDAPRTHRSGRPGPTPVKAAALAMDLPILEPDSARDPELVETLRRLAPETIVVAAYGRILPPEILAVPARWCINLHASLLPRYRGAAPVARAILEGERITGVTTMRMDRGLDTGDILLQAECAIGLVETTGELTVRLADLGAALLVETLEQHARGALEPRRQDEREATLAPPLSRADGRIDWSAPAGAIAGRVRACNPWPVARADLGGRTVQILRADVSLERAPAGDRDAVPGRVVAAGNDRLLVQCGGGERLAILELRFPGRRAISARDAVNGRLVRAGDIFDRAAAG
jgi:methionyl-tRNA formyltransferase